MLRFRRSLSISVATAVVLSLTSLAATASDASADPDSVKGGSAVAPADAADLPDTAKGLIVKTTTATPSDALLAATDDALGAQAEVVGDDQLTPKVSTLDFDEPISGDEAYEVAQQVAQRADVEWAVPNRRMYTQGASPVDKNDQLFDLQRNLWNTVASPVGGYSIKAPALWRKTEGSASTVVAVIDSGVIASHPDIASKLVAGYDMISDPATARDGGGRDSNPQDEGDWNAAGECGAGSRKSDSSWHGTFVTGQIAAVTNNGAGIAGVAPNVRVQPIRALGRCGGDLSDILDAMEYASTSPANAKIVNMSLGGAPMSKAARDQVCQAFTYYAQRGISRGVTYVAAAGNDGVNANLVAPASCTGFISVGATSVKGFGSIYSNVGSSVDLSAPGGDSTVEGASDRIVSLSNAGKQTPSTNGYGYAEGTSMAAPQVAGAAALLHGLGFTTPGQLTNAIYASVSPFRAWSREYSRKQVGPDRYDLNCRAKNRKWCGRGILDLSRVQAPLTRPTLSGTPIIGEPLRTSLGTWVRTPSAKFTWRVDGVVKSSSSVYWPSVADIGKTITSTITPANPAFAKLTNTSTASAAVPQGPSVTMAVSRTLRFGTNHVVQVSVEGNAAGPVQVRTDAGRVVGSGNVVAGRASIRVSGKAFKPGTYALRAAYLGGGTTPRASSPRKVMTVKKLTAKATIKLAKSVKKSKRAKLRITVSERPNLFASPTGQVRVYDGKKRILTTSLSSNGRGKKTVRLPKLKKGTHKIRIQYRGNGYIGSDYSAYRKIKVK